MYRLHVFGIIFGSIIQWIFRNKLHIYPDLGYRPCHLRDITGQPYQSVCNSVEAHDLTSPVPVARIVGSSSRWMTEDKIHVAYKIALIDHERLFQSRIKLFRHRHRHWL